jgi:putative transposase
VVASVWARKKINFSAVFAGQAIGIRKVHDDIWLVSFMDYHLGYFDLETGVLEALEISVLSSQRNCFHV